MASRRGKLAGVLLSFQAIFVLIFAFLAEYDDSADAKKFHNPNSTHGGETGIMQTYPLFQDVHVMIFLGIGFLLTYLKRYGFTSVGGNLLIGAFVVQWGTIFHGLLHLPHSEDGKFHLNVGSMLTADFAAATVLISFCVVLGKTSPLQLIVMALVEIPLFVINEKIGLEMFHAVDVGESMFIHVFAAYFGLAVARVLYSEDVDRSKKEGSVYHSDLFAMIGTLFLWIYWPSFNGAGASGDSRHRAVMNTYFSLASCTVVTFAVSSVLDKRGRFDMVHVQNATLAGGVVVGTTADMMIHPWGALLLGCLAGALSTVGYKYVTPFLNSKLKIHDTCGVNNLHGMPGILAGLAGAVVAALASFDNYGFGLYNVFAARIPEANTTELAVLQHSLPGLEPNLGRSAGLQAAFQILALVVTLGISIVGGLITGFIMRLPFFDNPKGDGMFDDADFWELPDEGFPFVEVDVNSKAYIAEHNVDTRINLV